MLLKPTSKSSGRQHGSPNKPSGWNSAEIALAKRSQDTTLEHPCVQDATKRFKDLFNMIFDRCWTVAEGYMRYAIWYLLCHMQYVICYMLYVISMCHVLYARCHTVYSLDAIFLNCFWLHAICYLVPAICFLLSAIFYILFAIFKLPCSEWYLQDVVSYMLCAIFYVSYAECSIVYALKYTLRAIA